MEYDIYQDFQSQYLKGVKQINHFVWRPSHNQEINLDNLIPYQLKYELHFNENGKLIKSIHYFKISNYTLFYYYDKNDRLSHVDRLDFNAQSGYIYSIFEYDDNSMIIGEKTYLSNPNFDEESYFDYVVHEYYQNLKISIIFRYDIDFEVYRSYNHYNNRGKLIEEKLVKDFNELILWDKLEYDDNGDLIKVSALNDNQSVDNIYIYFPDVNGMRSGYKSFSKDTNYTRHYEYDLNERGQWIRERAYNDNKLLFINKRDIYYF